MFVIEGHVFGVGFGFHGGVEGVWWLGVGGGYGSHFGWFLLGASCDELQSG